MVTELIFWGCCGFVVYTYLGYPLLLRLAARFRARPIQKAVMAPRVSFIIAVHNEARQIAEKIENTLDQDHPPQAFEVIVASDCSSDGTDEIVGSFSPRGVRLVRSQERRGKEHAQGLAVSAAHGDVLVFSDAATRLAPDGVRRIVMSFADPTVGCVSSVDRLLDDHGRPDGEGLYVRYEMGLRDLEAQVGSLVGLSGSFFAARREVCKPWRADTPSDFNIVLNAVTRGLRGVSDPRAVGYYRDLADARKEYARKVRTVARGVRGLLTHTALLNPLRYGIFSWQLLSHKLCRWLVPFALLGAATTSLLLARDSVLYRLLVILQLAAYLPAVLSLRWTTPALGAWRPIGYLLLANLSILNAWMDLARGRTAITWTPSERRGT
jgi:glycosyltransferase involved in cell wall biosynthesis